MVPSERAVEKLKDELVNRFSNLGIGFRVCQNLDPIGKTGLVLKLDKIHPGDQTIDVHGVHLILDANNSKRLDNMELDYVDGPDGGFILKDME